jgi:hypothetical protein
MGIAFVFIGSISNYSNESGNGRMFVTIEVVNGYL